MIVLLSFWNQRHNPSIEPTPDGAAHVKTLASLLFALALHFRLMLWVMDTAISNTVAEKLDRLTACFWPSFAVRKLRANLCGVCLAACRAADHFYYCHGALRLVFRWVLLNHIN
jgi:hypothetical protein